MSATKFTLAGACVLAIVTAAPGNAGEDDSQARAMNAQRSVSQPVVQPLKPRAQRRATTRATVRAPAASPKRYIFTLSDRFMGGKANAASDIDSIRAERDRNLAAQERAGSAFRRAGLTEVKVVRGSRFIAAAATPQQISTLRRQGLIQSVEPDRLSTPTLDQSVPLINPPQIWNFFNKGKGQVVAIIDTGVRADHEMLAGRQQSEACFSTTSAALGTSALCTSGSFAPGAGAPCSLTACWHGTHVAGIAVGRKNGANSMNGVAPDAQFISIQAFSEAQGNPVNLSSDLLSALYHIRDLKLAGKRIVSVNMSLGGGQYSSSCNTAIETIFQQLRSLNIAPVVSSGNDSYQGAVGYPACSPSAFTVGSSTKQDTMSPFSNLSSMVDVVAPGSGINSASSTGAGNYSVASGTSMAAPHVAGAFALMRQIYSCYPSGTLENALRNNGVPITGPGSTGTFPRIDLDASYKALGQFRIRNCPAMGGSTSQPVRKVPKAELKPL